MTVSARGPSLDVVDSVERRRCRLRTSSDVSPTRVAVERIGFPVDVAVAFAVERLSFPTVVGVYVRNAAGDLVVRTEHFAEERLPDGAYVLEIDGPIKLYLRTRGAVEITADGSTTSVTFDGETDVVLGARSRHRTPAATVSTTTDPADVLDAVSTFGSALKTTTCERSFPTLRGHPPAIAIADELCVPPSVTPPETGVRIELPAAYRYAYAVAPLSFYLGATLVESSTPRLVTAAGVDYPLGTGDRFETDVERLLKRVFFLDCLTRTEGRFPVELSERRRFEADAPVDLDFAALYGKPISEQLEAYLDVPYDAIEPLLPRWKLTAQVEPAPAHAELLPFFVDDLAIVRTAEPNRVSAAAAASGRVRELFTRGTDGGDRTGAGGERVALQPARSTEHVWAGDGVPIRASKALPAAYENHLGREPASGGIDITVVCNDPRMRAERDLLEDEYGSSDRQSVETTVYQELTAEEMADVLSSHTDFLHYVGHIDDEGFACVDGRFDAGSLDEVGADAFLLNACASYEQGVRLVEAGGVGGIVTLDVVADEDALRTGHTLASLLNQGFPLRAALDVVRRDSVVAGQYLVLGDGGLTVAQAESGTPYLCRLEARPEGYDLALETHAVAQRGMGSLVSPAVEGVDSYFLNSGIVGPFSLSEPALVEFFDLETAPVWYEGRLRRSSSLRDELRPITDPRK